jgi:hypothetical protein
MFKKSCHGLIYLAAAKWMTGAQFNKMNDSVQSVQCSAKWMIGTQYRRYAKRLNRDQPFLFPKASSLNISTSNSQTAKELWLCAVQNVHIVKCQETMI